MTIRIYSYRSDSPPGIWRAGLSYSEHTDDELAGSHPAFQEVFMMCSGESQSEALYRLVDYLRDLQNRAIAQAQAAAAAERKRVQR
jgi:hypothetical protein